ncbi:MAG: site-specific DNA-methyltransferase [Deltaproteobacteria bacterium]|nr:site-specific DNA-methyltransferase [Deltaproteobacteria bacterium]HCH66286.1 site-specific DNA-methyltransferase [Deltaproteobacteria bacterium]
MSLPVPPPESPTLPSAEPLADRRDALQALFPEAFSEGALDCDRLRAILGETTPASEERYGLHWAGRSTAMRAGQQPCTGTLTPDLDGSLRAERTENVFVEGDNLEVLKLLQKAYSGTMKMIYIDPPYNTGREFIYPDNFRDGMGEYLRFSGQIDAAGARTSTSTDRTGRVHSRWLSFMYPRLFLARNLLREDGLIAVSIDDHEVHNLRLLLDEIFGPENFVANLVWQKAYVANMTAKFISATHDHILVYARDADQAVVGRDPRTEAQHAQFTNPDQDPRGPWKPENLSAGKFYAAGQFAITTPTGRVTTPPPGRYWRCNKARYQEWLTDGRIWFGADGSGRPMLKKFLSEVRPGLTPDTWWKHEQVGTNKQATTELKRLFGGRKVFDTPKPVRLVERLVSLLAPNGGPVLDFFAGSGVTGHAVLRCNAADGHHRPYLLVQLPQPTDQPDLPTIAHITRARLRAAAHELEATHPALDVGWRAFRLTQSHFHPWTAPPGAPQALATKLQHHRTVLREGAAAGDVLAELLLKAGHRLTTTVETLELEGQTVHAVDGGRLMICLANPLSTPLLRAMMQQSPESVWCLDQAFAGDDALLRNTMLEMKSHGIAHFRTV